MAGRTKDNREATNYGFVESLLQNYTLFSNFDSNGHNKSSFFAKMEQSSANVKYEFGHIPFTFVAIVTHHSQHPIKEMKSTKIET